MAFLYCYIIMYGAGDRGRTGTVDKDLRILSPVRLPIPPHRQKETPKVGLEPTAYRLTAGCSTIELLRIILLTALTSVTTILIYRISVRLSTGFRNYF